MSGKRYIQDSTLQSERDYRLEHEREMRIRFMQADIPGITPPELQVEHIWRAQQSRCGRASTAAVNRMPVAAMAAMRPWAVAQRLPEHAEQVEGQAPKTIEGIIAAVPAAPPTWYQRAARDLLARLGKIGFGIYSYDSQAHTITLQRPDGSAVQVLLALRSPSWNAVPAPSIVSQPHPDQSPRVSNEQTIRAQI